MMKKVPKRRFKGFLNAGDWEQRKLIYIFSDFIVPMRDKPKVFSGTTPWTRIEDIEGRYINTSLSGQFVSDETIKSMNLKVIPKGSLIVSASATFGVVAIVNNDLITNQTFIGLVPNKDFDIDFLYFLFEAPTTKDKLLKLSAGSTIFYIARESFENLVLSVPSKAEQMKISKIFKSIDDSITLHQRKLEKLQATKKALLYELFPIENSRRPKRRFKGFTDDWEQRKLGEAATVEMNKRIFKEQTSSEGEVPFYKIGTFGGAADSYISRDLYEEYKKKYPYPNSGDILISASGSIGRTVVYNGEEAYFQDSNIVWLNHEGRINNSFLLQFYNVVKWSGLEGSTIKRLYNKNILETPILLPKLEEQQLIGGFLKLVDDNITLHQRKLEKLKNLKAAYLNEMFV